MPKSLLIIGLVSITTGVLTYLFWDGVIENRVYAEFILSKKSSTYEPWVKSQVPMSLKFYFFNWTNPSYMTEPGYKPEFEEVGPYTFWEKTEKVNLRWNENGTVSYQRLRKWFYDPDSSNGTLDDYITSVNAVALSAAYLSRSRAAFARMSLGVFISSLEDIFTTKSVRELLFDGYEDPLLHAGKNIPGFGGDVPFERFGWFYGKNGSLDTAGMFNVETGSNGIEHFGKIQSWNYKNHTGYYEGSCGSIVGSAGDFWPPKQTKEDDVVLFSPDLCRYIEFKFTNEVDIQGLTGYKYEAGINLMDDGTIDYKNECFKDDRVDLPFGVVDVRACRHNSPTFISYPHFYMADDWYRDSVGGMKPNPDLHNVYLALEPQYGIPLEVAARLQINMLIEPDNMIKMFGGVPRVMFPIMWFEQKVVVPSENLTAVKILVLLPTIGLTVACVSICAGLIALVACIVRRRHSTRRELSLVSHKSNMPKDAGDGDKIREVMEDYKSDIKANGDTAKSQHTHL